MIPVVTYLFMHQMLIFYQLYRLHERRVGSFIWTWRHLPSDKV